MIISLIYCSAREFRPNMPFKSFEKIVLPPLPPQAAEGSGGALNSPNKPSNTEPEKSTENKSGVSVETGQDNRKPVQKQTTKGSSVPGRPSPDVYASSKNFRSSLTVQKPDPDEQERPMRPESVMRFFGDYLTSYEHKEIFQYRTIYYTGASALKRPGNLNHMKNFGYDDERNLYQQVQHDHIGYRYEIIKTIGKGSFGEVIKAYDHKDHNHIALKMIRNEKRFHNQAKEEIRILENMKRLDPTDSVNIIHILDCFVFRNHVCITFDLLSLNLYEILKRRQFIGFKMNLVRKFVHSILICLDFLSRSRIIHCDLKPENILLKQPGRSGIKIIDFGSSCYENQQIYSYIQSRFYRAPEVPSIISKFLSNKFHGHNTSCFFSILFSLSFSTFSGIFLGENVYLSSIPLTSS